MPLEPRKILEIVNSKESCLCDLKKEHSELLMHVHGIGVTEYLTKIEGLENEIKINLRKKLARSNKDLFADILRPTDKIFNSDGGSKVYHFSGSDKRNQEILQNKLSDIVDGYSLSEWLETYFIDKYVTDPNGLFMIEHDDGIPYPTYKSIYSIKAYEQKGRYIEWMIFEPETIYDEKGKEDYKEVRVYDNTGDYLYKVKGDNITLIDEYPNPWGYVPAITCSDLIDTITGYKKTPVDEQKEIAGEYLRDVSVKTLFKYHHGFPLFWMYMSTCPVCKGFGEINREKEGKMIQSSCPQCNGTGYSVKKDVSDVTAIKPPDNNETPQITPNIAGYITPPIDSWQQMTEELKVLRDMVYFSHWGTIINRDDNEKTAFEVGTNIQPMQDRLNKYSNALEKTESIIVDMIGAYMFKDQYKGCSINYGRNYIIKGANEILNSYLEHKSKGANYTVLNDKLNQYYHSLYAHDPYNLLIHLKLIKIEPYVHNTITEVAGWNLPLGQFKRKLYYNDWLNTITKEELINKTVEQLIESLNIYVESKQINNEQSKEV